MHHCGSGFLLTLALAFVAALTGCLGKSSANLGNAGVTKCYAEPRQHLFPRGGWHSSL